MSAPVIDSHLHLWQRSAGAYPWLTPELGPLDRDFSAAEARAELDAAGVQAAVLVQADDTLADTEFLLDIAAEHDWVLGVVGWVPLDEPDAAAAALERWSGHAAFCGVRQLVHDDPRAGVLALPAVRRTLGLLAERGLPFDVPDAWPRHLADTADLAEELPELSLVIDHLGKPPLGAGTGSAEYGLWLREMRRIAAPGTAVAKLSGLHLPGVPYTAAALRPVWESALELFGPARLLVGGDWPITVAHGGYQRSWAVLTELIGELSPGEQALVLGGTAEAVYGLAARRAGGAGRPRDAERTHSP